MYNVCTIHFTNASLYFILIHFLSQFFLLHIFQGFKQFMTDPPSVDHTPSSSQALTASTSSSTSSTSSSSTPSVPTTNVIPPPLSSSHPNILRSNSTSASSSSRVSPVLPSKAAVSRGTLPSIIHVLRIHVVRTILMILCICH